jgi:hypothetical protein
MQNLSEIVLQQHVIARGAHIAVPTDHGSSRISPSSLSNDDPLRAFVWHKRLPYNVGTSTRVHMAGAPTRAHPHAMELSVRHR